AVAAGVATTLGPERDAAGPADPFGRGGAGTRLGALVLACLIVGALTALILTISYLGHEPFTAYRRGLASIYSNWSPTYRGLCLGRYEPKFWYYFLVAVALKAPLGTLGLLLAALVLSVAARRARADARTELCLHVPALVLFVATSTLAAPPTAWRVKRVSATPGRSSSRSRGRRTPSRPISWPGVCSTRCSRHATPAWSAVSRPASSSVGRSSRARSWGAGS